MKKLFDAIEYLNNERLYPKQALIFVNKAIEIVGGFDDIELKADALKLKAEVFNILRNKEEALEYANQAIKIYESLGNKNKIAASHFLFGFIYFRNTMENEEAEKHFNKALALCSQTNNDELKIKVLTQFSHFYNHANNTEKDLDCLYKILDLSKKLNNKESQSYALSSLGYVDNILGHTNTAIDFTQKALRIDMELKNNKNIAYDYDILGRIYENISDYDKALEYYNLSLNLSKKTNDLFHQSDTYGALAFIYSHKKMHKEAVANITKRTEIHKNLGINEDKSFANWRSLGYIYSEAGLTTEAYNFYQKGLILSRKLGTQIDMANILIGIANIYIKESDAVLVKIGIDPSERYLKVEELATEALMLSKNNNLRIESKKALQLLSAVYEQKKDYIKAHELYKQYVELKDSISGDDVKKQITRKEIQYEFDKKETALKYDQQLTAGQLEKERLLTFQQGQTLTLNSQNLTLKEQALALSNKQKDLTHLAFLKEQAEKQEKTQELSLSEEREKGAALDLSLKNLELSAQQKQNLYLGLFSLLLLGGFAALLYFYNALKKQKNIISQQNELNEHTIAILSHDIKEPLLGVKLMLKKLNKDDPFVAQASLSLENQVNVVNGILSNLLKMKKLALTKKDKNAKANAKSVVQNVIQELSIAIQSKDLTIQNELPDELMLPIAPEKLQIIVNNLLSNAVKYSFPNQNIRIFQENNGFCIQDFGVGLSPEQRSKIMREVTVSKQGTNAERGNGMGLFLIGAMLQGEQIRVFFDSPEVGGTIAKVLGQVIINN